MSLVKLSRRPNIASTLPSLPNLPDRLRQFFDDGFFGVEPFASTGQLGWIPATEIVENADALVLTSELPGMKRDDVEIVIDDGVLTIRGEKVEERKEGDDDRKFHLWERSYGSFSRSFEIPRMVDAAGISADFADGILTVTMPKTAEARAKGRKIEIAAR